MKNNEIPLVPDRVYHIYSHANGKENLFVKRDNYVFFLKKYAQYIEPIAETFAYCLMPNHIHFMIRVRSEDSLIEAYAKAVKEPDKVNIEDFTEKEIYKYLSRTFGNLFSSYTQAFNKQQNRKGSLFIPNFKRKEIASNRYYKSLIHYIHRNPLHHGFAQSMADWEFSSYNPLLSEKPTKLERTQVIEWYGNKNIFEEIHKNGKVDYKPDFVE